MLWGEFIKGEGGSRVDAAWELEPMAQFIDSPPHIAK